jgi:hypothetical protein
MRSGLKASLSRFNIVSAAKCGCGEKLQAEEHMFLDCKLYEGKRATMMDILSENSKKEYPKICARRLLIHEQNS